MTISVRVQQLDLCSALKYNNCWRIWVVLPIDSQMNLKNNRDFFEGYVYRFRSWTLKPTEWEKYNRNKLRILYSRNGFQKITEWKRERWGWRIFRVSFYSCVVLEYLIVSKQIKKLRGFRPSSCVNRENIFKFYLEVPIILAAKTKPEIAKKVGIFCTIKSVVPVKFACVIAFDTTGIATKTIKIVPTITPIIVLIIPFFCICCFHLEN